MNSKKLIIFLFYLSINFLSLAKSMDHKVNSLANNLSQSVKQIDIDNYQTTRTAQQSWVDLTIYLQQHYLFKDYYSSNPIFKNISNKDDLNNLINKFNYTNTTNENNPLPNLYAISYLLFSYDETAENKLNNLKKQQVINITIELVRQLKKISFKESLSKQQILNQIDIIKNQFIQGLGDSIAKSNIAYFPAHYSRRTLDIYFWQLSEFENFIIKSANKNNADLIINTQNQFINTYRKLVIISHSIYKNGSGAIFRAKQPRDFAVLIDHDDANISLSAQIQSVSGRKKIQQLIAELNKLKLDIYSLSF